jgi:hypothetical protein
MKKQIIQKRMLPSVVTGRALGGYAGSPGLIPSFIKKRLK